MLGFQDLYKYDLTFNVVNLYIMFRKKNHYLRQRRSFVPEGEL